MIRANTAFFACVSLLPCLVMQSGAADVATLHTAGWRNDGSGRFPLATPPIEWSDTRNIVWTTKVGLNKYSSPVLANGRIFLTTDPALLVCVNAADGKILWQKSNGFADLPNKVEEKPFPGTTATAGNTTPTPVTDGQYVYAVYGNGIVACYDLAGERKWIQHFDLKIATEYGRATSPILVGGKFLVTLNHLIAIDPVTGKMLWENKEIPEMYGSPTAAKIGGVDVAVMPCGSVVRVEDGKTLVSDLGGLSFASPVVVHDTVYFIQTASSAQKLSVTGDKWQAKQLWDQELEGTFYASALYDKGLIYAVSNENVFMILDAANGKILETKPLDLETANMYPSLSMAGSYLFIFNDQGEALVLEPGKQYKEVKRNHLPKGHGGGPVFDGKFMYIRGGANLYCIGGK